MNKIERLRKRRNAIITEYLVVADLNRKNSIDTSPVESKLLFEWSEVNNSIISLKNQNVQKPFNGTESNGLGI